MHENYIKLTFEEIIKHDYLCVMASGLGIEQLFIKCIKYYILLIKSLKRIRNDRRIIFIINLTDHVAMMQQGFRREGIMPLDMPIVSNVVQYSFIFIFICIFSL